MGAECKRGSHRLYDESVSQGHKDMNSGICFLLE